MCVFRWVRISTCIRYIQVPWTCMGWLHRNSILLQSTSDSMHTAQFHKFVEFKVSLISKMVCLQNAVSRLTQENRLPHLLLYGPPGTGKTSTILAVARQLYGHQGYQNLTLELNASDDRGIDFVRNQIQDFASTKRIFRYANFIVAPSMRSFDRGLNGCEAFYRRSHPTLVYGRWYFRHNVHILFLGSQILWFCMAIMPLLTCYYLIATTVSNGRIHLCTLS